MKKKLPAYMMVNGPLSGLLMARLPRRFSFPEFDQPVSILFAPTEEGIRFSFVDDATLNADFQRNGHVIVSRQILEYVEQVQKDLALNGFPPSDSSLQ